MTREYFQVPVAEVIRETDEACSLVLDMPPPLASVFAYRPGQFVTVRVPSQACGSVARCYSLSSSPLLGERPAITVKRTEGGYASNWIFDRVRAGTVPLHDAVRVVEERETRDRLDDVVQRYPFLHDVPGHPPSRLLEIAAALDAAEDGERDAMADQ